MKLFGYKCRLEVIVICIILGIFIGVNTMCGCNCNKEGFVSPSRPAQVSDNGMSIGVPGQNTGDESWRKHMPNNSETQINFPVHQYPETPKSLNIAKEQSYTGKLVGIKGQYLIFEDQKVFNIRSNEGIVVRLTIN